MDPLFRFVWDETARIRTHLMWMYTYYHCWNIYNPSIVYLRQHSWEFMRTNIDYVTQAWANLNTLIESNDRPELRALLDSMEQYRPIWHTVKTF
uniref:Uncharacterized protein n=1 Tax=Anopheles minimus TaxID=112268 RepID=A0A182W7C8_9DIPT